MTMPSFGKVRLAVCAACLVLAVAQGVMLLVAMPEHNSIMEQAARIAEVDASQEPKSNEHEGFTTMVFDGRDIEVDLNGISSGFASGKHDDTYRFDTNSPLRGSGIPLSAFKAVSKWEFMTTFGSDDSTRQAVWLGMDSNENIVAVLTADWALSNGKFSNFDYMEGTSAAAPVQSASKDAEKPTESPVEGTSELSEGQNSSSDAQAPSGDASASAASYEKSGGESDAS